MKDFLGNELNTGDNVVYLVHRKTSSHFETGIIAEIKNKTVIMKDGTRKNPDKIVKINYN